MVLAEGQYRAIARYEGRVFERSFDVVNGVDGGVSSMEEEGVVSPAGVGGVRAAGGGDLVPGARSGQDVVEGRVREDDALDIDQGVGRAPAVVLHNGRGRADGRGVEDDARGQTAVVEPIGDQVEALLADKGYDGDAIRAELAEAGAEAVIPAKTNRRIPIPHDRAKYRWRNLVERLFSKLKNWRRVATRYDKTKESYLGFVALASIKLWIPFAHDA